MMKLEFPMVLRALLPVCLLISLGAPAAGQESRKGEVMAMAGAGAYSDGVFADFGGGAAYRLSRRLALVGEFHRIGAKKDETVLGVLVQAKSWEGDLLGGAHILFPVGSGKVEPYISVGSGLCHSRSEATASVRGRRVEVQESETTPALFVGGGIRVFGSARWGIRPEVKVMGGGGGLRLLATVGFFYRFK